MKHLPRLLMMLILSVSWCAFGTAAHAHPQSHPKYRLSVILGSNDEVFVSGLNEKGEMAVSFSANGGDAAALVRGDQVILLGDLEGGNSPFADATGLNDRTDVIGVSLVPPPHQIGSFLWHRGQIEDLGVPPGVPENAAIFVRHINNRRQILFFATNGDTFRYFIGHHDTFTALDAVPGGTGQYEVFTLNEPGDAVGSSDTADGLTHPVIWHRDSTVEVLGMLPGTTNMRGMDINDRGDVIGVGVSANFQFQRAFVWRDGTLSELPLLNPTSSEGSSADSMNNQEQVVGVEFNRDSPSPSTALLWDHGHAMALNDLVKANDPLRPFVTIFAASLINDRGQIVASGHDSRDPNHPRNYLLTPVD